MAESDNAELQARLAELEEELAKVQEERVVAQAELQATTATRVPDMEVEVLEGSTISPAGQEETFASGETLVMTGPDAMALATTGHVKILGTKDTVTPTSSGDE